MANVKQVMISVINKESGKNKYFRFKQSECMVDWQLVHKLVAKANRCIENQKGLTRVMLLLSEDEKNRRYGTMYAYRVFQADIKNPFTPQSMTETVKRLLKSDLSDFILADGIYLYPQEVKYNDAFLYRTLNDIEDVHTILKYGGTYFIKNIGTHYMYINARLLWDYPLSVPDAFTARKISDCYSIGDVYRRLYLLARPNDFYRAIKNAYGKNKNNIYRFTVNGYQTATCLTCKEFGKAAEKWWKKSPKTRFIILF